MRTNTKVNLIRETDKNVFGTVRSVTIKSLKEYAIKDGTVKINYKNKWAEVEEHRSSKDAFTNPRVQIADWNIYH